MKTKNLIVALILSVGLFTTSCNSSDENEGDTIAPIVGKWQYVKSGTNVGGAETLVDYPGNVSGCDHDFIDLKLDNTAVAGNYDSTVSPCALTTVSGTYDRGDSKVTVTVNGVTTTYDIVNLTATELKLKDGNNVYVFIR
ncbi:lipocalin family protein [Flavobacterium sp.]|uniref:lipocalin family protein n=1 Tax=Flavobacterium sp. TaxID=239 RepID=UPI002C9BD396|nr:lipocalin family protein [Flavobacterium sp.]HSD06723.1 lipocalin family protein [Flavobacterium sp.]